MRRATENQGNTRTLSEYFSPRSKVKDLALQECSLPHISSFIQETPMKPSQVPNQLPHPPPRRMLPLQSPELCHRDRLGPPRHPSHHMGPIHSGFVPSSPTNIGYPVSRPHPTPSIRLDPLHHPAQPPGSFCPRFVPVSPTNSGTTANRPQPSPPFNFHPATPQFMKDLSNHSPSSPIRRDQATESKVTLPYSGSKNPTAQRQESNKAQSSDARSSIHTVQLHRPPMTPVLNTRAAQEVGPLPHSDSEHWSPVNSQWPPRGYQPSPSTHSFDRSSGPTLPIMYSPVAPCQDQQHKRTPSSEKFIPVDMNYSSQKRYREFEDCDDGAKKLCLQGANSQTPKPSVGNSLSTSLVSQPSSGPSSVLELSPKTTESHLCTEPACGQSTYLELSSTFKPTQSSCASLSPKPCIKRRPSTGAKQAYINSSQNHTVKLIELQSPSKPREDRSEENNKSDKSSSSLSSEVPQKATVGSPHFQSGSHPSGNTYRSTSVLPVKTLSRGNQVEESRKTDSSTPKPASKPNSSSLSGRTVERNKPARPRRPVAVSYDITELFTPDPIVVCPTNKKAKPKIDGGTTKSLTQEKACSSSAVSSTTTTGSSCLITQTVTVTSSQAVDANVSFLSSAPQPQISLPTVALERVKLENLRSFCPKDVELQNLTSSGRERKDESVKSDDKRTSLLPNNVRSCALETDTAASEQTLTFQCRQSPLLERGASEGGKKQVKEDDPMDVELDLGLSFAVDLDLTQSSHSSEEEQLLSLQEMMECVTKPPDTPEKGAFSEPSTPGHHSCMSKTLPLPSTTKSGIYKNNLDQMLKEINTTKKAKEIETQLLTACKEDLLRIAEYEEAEENREEGISSEHQEFLQRYSLMSSAIREVPPGEVVFNLEKFGQIFNHNTLQLRQCMVNPQGTVQKTLLWSSPAQLRLHVNIGLFQEAYDCLSPCPTQVTRFLFQMMSVHSERMISEKILQALCDIACTAAYQIVKNGSQQFKVWVPSLADVALVLMNMGVAFVTLFPFENLQPPFTEGDLLEDIYIKSESPSNNKEQSAFPEHNCNNILKYLSYCMGLCPRAYSDDELLLLLTVVGRVGLDTRLLLQSSVELYPLQYKIVNNIRDWNTMLPRICLAITDLTDDHHNMCLLVQLLPDNTRGKQLRRHLSLSMISKLLDGNCMYRPTDKEIQLSKLRPYLPRMQPSTILRAMLSSSRSQKDKDEDMDTLDQQSYYLCYSLLTLANEASNFQFFPAHQKEQLLILCSELETHVKCDIRESEKCLYRSKVKDLVARIYTKWQMLLQRTRPLHGKLYDYWQPLPVDTLTSSQEEQEIDGSDDREESVMEDDDGEETSGTEENEVVMTAEDEEKEEGDDTVDDTNKAGGDKKPEEFEGDCAMDGTNETEEATESVLGELNQEMPEMEPQVHKESKVTDEQMESKVTDEQMESKVTDEQMESKVTDVQMEAGNKEPTEVETENQDETREASHHNQVAECDLVS
ncbi:uncharacterized protein slf2 isoform X2 [Dicentrarchus labrax]|uniref:Coiled-coil SMC6 And NSE5 INteracting (CANIN) domain-containing protein n=1 Tax=Dicentrarchus labrax TaxID=13489 RepID=A0A8C4FDI6_DICLA|nr:uncharacterized protein slf2 isoform X2 [Dicentrarchus labrax]